MSQTMILAISPQFGMARYNVIRRDGKALTPADWDNAEKQVAQTDGDALVVQNEHQEPLCIVSNKETPDMSRGNKLNTFFATRRQTKDTSPIPKKTADSLATLSSGQRTITLDT